MDIDEKLVQRFWKYVDRGAPDECWNWTGAVLHGARHLPYGYLGVRRTTVRAHRLSYAIHKGEIPDGMNVLHTCDNPRCVNPNHLYPGTQADNMADTMRRGRHNPPFGERNGRAALTAGAVATIRAENPASGAAREELAKRFNVTVSAIHAVLANRTWKGVHHVS